jgi:predicted ArsR family transcriptional regulator
MTKPKNDYPGRVPRFRPTRAAAAEALPRIVEALTNEPKQSVAALATALGLSQNTIRDRLAQLDIAGRIGWTEIPGATQAARVKLYSMRAAAPKQVNSKPAASWAAVLFGQIPAGGER